MVAIEIKDCGLTIQGYNFSALIAQLGSGTFIVVMKASGSKLISISNIGYQY
jgi:hypothetical protein